MLIRRAELEGQLVDVRIAAGRIAAIGALSPQPGEAVVEAAGGALLPGLHDHHLHLYATAAARASVRCGPPEVQDAAALAQALRAADAALPPGEWLRGVGWHESVGGDLGRDWLDAQLPARPARIQHRSGRMWLLNSAALAQVEQGVGDPLERERGRATGRLYDADAWLRAHLGGRRPSLAALSRGLAGRGVVGVTDTSHDNGADSFEALAAAQQRGELLQELCVMGDASLDSVASRAGLLRGARKFHLHEHELPDFDTLCADIRASHEAQRAAAFHCVTRTDLAYALAALAEAGVRVGDRIEHASITPPELLAQIRELGLIVVTQPGFVAERGDTYLREVEAHDQPWLYRLRAFLEAGVPLAGSSDAPYGDADPWKAMAAAVSRRTAAGEPLGPDEALSPELALALFTAALEAPGALVPPLAVGTAADLCLLQQPWAEARRDLAAVQLRLTLLRGEILHVAQGGNGASSRAPS